MKLYCHRYEHEPLPKKTVAGAVLRVVFGAWTEGFSDLHPWTEFGDEDLEHQLERISKKSPARLGLKSLYFANIDAQGRRHARNLLAGLDWPVSHALADLHDLRSVEDAVEKGFTRIKVKMGGDLAVETRNLARFPELRWRIDFNGKLSAPQFENWWRTMDPDLRSRIDAVEDPFERATASISSAPIYSDWIEASRDAKIFKPARDFSFLDQKEKNYRRVIFTHSLDHPLGQVSAVWEASRFYHRYPKLRQVCGFSPVPSFSDLWCARGPRFRPPPGHGFGFDEWLHSVRWERVL